MIAHSAHTSEPTSSPATAPRTASNPERRQPAGGAHCQAKETAEAPKGDRAVHSPGTTIWALSAKNL